MEQQRHLHSDAVITGSRDSRKGTTLHGEIGPTRRKIPRRIAEQAFDFFIGSSEEHYRQKGNEIRKQKSSQREADGCQQTVTMWIKFHYHLLSTRKNADNGSKQV